MRCRPGWQWESDIDEALSNATNVTMGFDSDGADEVKAAAETLGRLAWKTQGRFARRPGRSLRWGVFLAAGVDGP
jgi:hypothetical protein